MPQQAPAPEGVEAAALTRLGVVILAVAVLTDEFGGIVGKQRGVLLHAVALYNPTDSVRTVSDDLRDGSVRLTLNLNKGQNTIRLYNDNGSMPDIDYMQIDF